MPDHRPWDMAAWSSPRDCTEMPRAAVEADGITFAIGNGISANRHRVTDLVDTMRMLNYHPVDDAWARR